MKSILVTLLVSAAALHATPPYQIDWFTFGGGGGQSSGGIFTLVGTIGQPDAGMSSGDGFALHGGFWGAFVVPPTEDAPSLRIVGSGPNLILAWPNPSADFQLQESPSLAPPNWTDVTAKPDLVDAENQVRQTATFGARFYRLHKP